MPVMTQINRIYICLAMLIGIVTTVQAEKVYRSVDDKGVVEFSDQGGKRDAEEMEVPQIPTYEFKKVERPAPKTKEKPVEAPAAEIEIISPGSKETIRNNQGDLAVELKFGGARSKAEKAPAKAKEKASRRTEAEPEDFSGLNEGEKIVVLLDGKIVLETDKPKVVLNNVERGTHELKVSIVSAEGKQVAESQPVEFYMKRFSRLFKKPANPVNTNSAPAKAP